MWAVQLARLQVVPVRVLAVAACVWGSQDVPDQTSGQQAVEDKSYGSAQHRAIAVGGFGQSHHERDIQPGNNNKIHKKKRQKRGKNDKLRCDLYRFR